MKGSSSNRPKQTGVKPEKTRDQKNAHNANCQKSRQKMKMRHEELEKVNTKYTELLPKFQRIEAENKRMKLELNQKNSQIFSLKDEIVKLKMILQKQEGCSSSLEKWQEWVLSQTCEVGQGSDYILGGYGSAAQPSFLANQNLSSASHFPNPNNDLFTYDPVLADQSGFFTASAAGSSSFANQDLPLLSDDNSDIFTDDHSTGFPTTSAAAAACSFVFNSLNNQGNDDLFTLDDLEDFCCESNPSSKRN